MFTKPTLQKDNKFFENKKHPPKVLDNNTYPVTSIFEFISKLNKLIYSNIEDNKKVYIGFRNPESTHSKFFNSIRDDFSTNPISKIIEDKKIYSCMLLLGHSITNNCSVLKRFKTKDVHLFSQNYISINIYHDALGTLLIDSKTRANLFKQYIASRLMLTESIYIHYGYNVSHKDIVRNLPISLKFFKDYPIKIFVKNISKDSVFITWGYSYVSENSANKYNFNDIKEIERMQDIRKEKISDEAESVSDEAERIDADAPTVVLNNGGREINAFIRHDTNHRLIVEHEAIPDEII